MCEAFATKHKIYRLYQSITSFWDNRGSTINGAGNIISCAKRLTSHVGVTLGGSLNAPGIDQSRKNFFPYEYRPINHDFLTFGFETPPNYVYSGSNVNSWFPVYNPGGTALRRIVNGSLGTGNIGAGTITTSQFDLGTIYYEYASEDLILGNGNPIDDITNSNNAAAEVANAYLIHGDEKWLQRLNIYFDPDPSCPPAITSLVNVDAVNQLATPLCAEPILNDITSSTYNLIATTPNLVFIGTPVLPVTTNPGTLSFTIDHASGPTHLAEFIYVKLVPPPGLTINWVTINGTLVPAPVLASGLIPVGTSVGFLDYDFVVDFTVDDCSLSQVIWPIQYGHGCVDYPATVNDLGCVENTEIITIPLESAAMSGVGTQDNSIALCDVAQYSGCFSSTQNGVIGDFNFAIELPTGASISGSPTATGPGGVNFTPVFVNNVGNVYNYSLDPSWELTNLADQICIDFDVLYAGDCYNYGTEAPKLTLNGTPYCQTPIVSFEIQYTPLQITGSNCVPLVLSGIVQDVTCNDDGAIDITVTGQSQISYSWDNGPTSEDISNLTPGNYTVTVTDGYGCMDSQTFTVTNINVADYIVDGCTDYTLSDGTIVTSSGNYTISTTDANGCTLIENYTVTIHPENTVTQVINECGSYTWPVNGTTYTVSGTYTEIIQDQFGCDQTYVLNLTITTNTPIVETITACDTYTWPINGTTYTSSGVYNHSVVDINDCIQLYTLNLTINFSTTTTINETHCDNYIWPLNGMTYTSSGTHSHTVVGTNGCDETTILNLTINNSQVINETVSECDTYTWPVNGQTYTTSGTYFATGTTPEGCLIEYVLNLTINMRSTIVEDVFSCTKYTWAVNGTVYNQSGTYTSTSIDMNGCTVTNILNLTISAPDLTVSQSGGTFTSNQVSATAYQWYFCDPVNGLVLIPGATSQSYTPMMQGSYAVYVLLDNGIECDGFSACIPLEWNVSISEEELFSEVKLFPNPSPGLFNLDFGRDYEDVSIRVLTLTGQVVSTNSLRNTSHASIQLDVNAGIYFVELTLNGQRVIRELVIQ